MAGFLTKQNLRSYFKELASKSQAYWGGEHTMQYIQAMNYGTAHLKHLLTTVAPINSKKEKNLILFYKKIKIPKDKKINSNSQELI